MMTVAGVRRDDQRRALCLSTTAFPVCYAGCTIFSIIGLQIKKELGLNETQFGLLIGRVRTLTAFYQANWHPRACPRPSTAGTGAITAGVFC